MEHFKGFELTLSLTPEQDELSRLHNILFLHDENGVDWYIRQLSFNTETVKIQYDNEGVIVAMDSDVSKLFPLNCSVIEIDKESFSSEIKADGNWIFSNGSVTRKAIDYVSLASAQRDSEMAWASSGINALVDSQQDGDITPDEEIQLAKLREYRSNLRQLDVTHAPDVAWPERP
ncbi:Caudovirales tail fibre assembly protein [Cedecea davisae]|nr:tail fiber assembly protein [Cedecea davisae]SUX38081.1 Caudovirales tail fibre assembly protein [Cedecea davisae]